MTDSLVASSDRSAVIICVNFINITQVCTFLLEILAIFQINITYSYSDRIFEHLPSFCDMLILSLNKSELWNLEFYNTKQRKISYKIVFWIPERKRLLKKQTRMRVVLLKVTFGKHSKFFTKANLSKADLNTHLKINAKNHLPNVKEKSTARTFCQTH